MHVISRRPLQDFSAIQGDAESPLKTWFKAASAGRFSDLVELKQTFGNVDYVRAGGKGFYVFDIGGNKYRLIARVDFEEQMLLIQTVMTHEKYNRERP